MCMLITVACNCALTYYLRVPIYRSEILDPMPFRMYFACQHGKAASKRAPCRLYDDSTLVAHGCCMSAVPVESSGPCVAGARRGTKGTPMLDD